MQNTTLRKVGGSVMLSVPPALLEVLGLAAGADVGLSIEEGRLIVQPLRRPKYTMAELLAASDYTGSPTAEDLEWERAPAVGRELL